jgi:3'-phosphoadenosine 5'-phosphosulfate sulfotransferase (PAPS reductase)/FAD synthetase
MSTLNKKVGSALGRLEKLRTMFSEESIFTGHSGGKDSVVILNLAKKVFPNIRVVHNVKPLLGTSGDPVAALTEQHPKTLEFLYTVVCKQTTVEFLHPSKMLDFVKAQRLLCQIDGARIEESTRPGKSSDIIRNGISINRSLMQAFEPVGIFNLSISYPILDWTSNDVFEYIEREGLQISEEYELNGEWEAYREG